MSHNEIANESQISCQQVVDELQTSRQQVVELINWVVAAIPHEQPCQKSSSTKFQINYWMRNNPIPLCDYNLTCDLSDAIGGLQIITSCKCLMQPEN